MNGDDDGFGGWGIALIRDAVDGDEDVGFGKVGCHAGKGNGVGEESRGWIPAKDRGNDEMKMNARMSYVLLGSVPRLSELITTCSLEWAQIVLPLRSMQWR